jgi:transposase
MPSGPDPLSAVPGRSGHEHGRVLFDLPGYRVLDAVDLPGGGRRVVIEAVPAEDGCPDCGVLSSRVHKRTRQRLRDVPVAGRIVVELVKRRLACLEPVGCQKHA